MTDEDAPGDCSVYGPFPPTICHKNREEREEQQIRMD